MGSTEWKTSACILCECNCGLKIELGGDDGRRFVKLRGDREHPMSQGYACEKAHRLDFYQNNPERLTTPLRRRADGTFEAIDWDTAITEVASRLAAVRDEHGGESIFYYGGGGQGNHLPGAYAAATRRALGSRWRSSALAQEKTGEFWVSDRMLGGFTRSDFEHCEVGVFLGKNPWHSHSIARARVTLKELSRDPARTLIVVDPRRTETAELADIHLQVKPGRDAWLVAAMAATMVEESLLDEAFISAHTEGVDAVRSALAGVSIADYSAYAGVDEALVRRAARCIAGAESVASFEDLGVQMNRHSTLVSYLHRMLWLLTGNFGKRGTQYMPTPLLSIAGGDTGRKSPVVGARIIGGMVPCNVIAEEILTEHPKRYRAMIVETANPAHSLADSKRFREAMSALDTLVVIDVAMSETAQLADYVLPASTQYEKAEATFFNFEFPDNAFQLRPRLLDPPDGTLPEAEIHARLVEALGAITEAELAPLHAAAAKGRPHYAGAFFKHVMTQPRLAGIAPVILYRTLGPTLPVEVREGAVLWGLALRFAQKASASLARAGFAGPPPLQADTLFQALIDTPSGVVFARDLWEDVLGRVGRPGGTIQLELPDLLAELATLDGGVDGSGLGTAPDPKFPYILAAGERRSFTANTIIRNPAWRKKDGAGALRLCLADAAELGVVDGDYVRVTTRAGSAVVAVELSASMQAGHISLPNGLGVGFGGRAQAAGVALNELTSLDARDPFVGTPWHKHVPARLEPVPAPADVAV